MSGHCPDCGQKWPAELPNCPHCDLSIDDLEAAAAFCDNYACAEANVERDVFFFEDD